MEKIYDNKVEHGSVNVPGKKTGDGDTTEQPSDSGATSTKVQEPPAEALTKGPQEAKVNNFEAPPTSNCRCTTLYCSVSAATTSFTAAN